MNLAQQKLSQPHSPTPLLSSPLGSLHSPSGDLGGTLGSGGGVGVGGGGATTPHGARQLNYAQLSRQSSSPHHHARAAAAMARSAPVTSTVTIVDPNNPAKPFINGTNTKKPDDGNRTTSVAASTAADPNQTWTTLDLGGMGLKNIAPALCQYTFLTALFLNHNNVTYLTPTISKLVNLRTLDVSGNKLTAIPPELGLLIQLRELLLFDNNLVTLPSELGTLYNLETLGLEGNPMDAEIKNLLMKEGSQAVIISLRENAPVGMPPPQRMWETIESDVSEEQSDKFTVLCYNILSQRYATSQAYGYTPSWALNGEYRKDLLLREISGCNADVICLQEVEMALYEDVLVEYFKEAGNYDGVFYPKSRARTMSEKEQRAVDGCATFYRASKFNLVENSLLEYTYHALQRSDFKKTADIYNRVMTKDNIAILTMLENRDTLERVLVANSHIHWDPSFADVKLVQVGMLMDQIEAFATKHLQPPATTATTSADGSSNGSGSGRVYGSTSKLPTIICGDFNSVPDSGVYEFLSKGSVRQDHDDFGDHIYGNYTTDGLSHKLSLKSSYSHIGELPFTNYTPTFKGVLDYIWYSNNTLDVISLLGAIDKDYVSKAVGFPNAHFPSDHILIMSEFKFRPPRREAEEAKFNSTSKRHHHDRPGGGTQDSQNKSR
ncbi:Endonuclease/exonuclease/phosphatase [Phycomyces blakesleeanus]|uniref:poly(A)-specific ribonuclease n=1 Tax=Phycomyces blakesleeanus TaxID=4837 RepID=A0ABR3B3K0_PHYBL